jgi:hypothetical protein
MRDGGEILENWKNREKSGWIFQTFAAIARN